jgi:hypothetical protein
VVQQWLASSASMQQLYQSAQASAKKQHRLSLGAAAPLAAPDAAPDAALTEARRVRFPEMPARIVGEGAPLVSGDGDEDDEDDDEEEDDAPPPTPIVKLSWQEQLQQILVRASRMDTQRERERGDAQAESSPYRWPGSQAAREADEAKAAAAAAAVAEPAPAVTTDAAAVEVVVADNVSAPATVVTDDAPPVVVDDAGDAAVPPAAPADVAVLHTPEPQRPAFLAALVDAAPAEPAAAASADSPTNTNSGGRFQPRFRTYVRTAEGRSGAERAGDAGAAPGASVADVAVPDEGMSAAARRLSDPPHAAAAVGETVQVCRCTRPRPFAAHALTGFARRSFKCTRARTACRPSRSHRALPPPTSSSSRPTAPPVPPSSTSSSCSSWARASPHVRVPHPSSWMRMSLPLTHAPAVDRIVPPEEPVSALCAAWQAHLDGDGAAPTVERRLVLRPRAPAATVRAQPAPHMHVRTAHARPCRTPTWSS